ncbi:MAG TPA: hypothetical protein VKK79_01355 [Candidatus Lokiarchaeia archaeon]|nr:hypothetical protein [Candidatus Lokiarchaeia archaeon]
MGDSNNTPSDKKRVARSIIEDYIETCFKDDQPSNYEDCISQFGFNDVQCPRGWFNKCMWNWGKGISRISYKNGRRERQQWFDGKRLEKPSSIKTQVWEYLEYRYANNKSASYDDFLKKHNYTPQQVPKGSFGSYLTRWKIYIAKSFNATEYDKRLKWFNEVRLDSPITMKDRINEFIDNQYSLNAPASYKLFLQNLRISKEEVSRKGFNREVSAWGNQIRNIMDAGERSKKQLWFEVKRLERPLSKKEKVWKYLDTKFEVNENISYEDFLDIFRLTTEEISKNLFNNYVYSWGQAISHSNNKSVKKQNWFNENSNQPSKNITSSIFNYIEECFLNDLPASRSDFIAKNNYSKKQVPASTFSNLLKKWETAIEEIPDEDERHKHQFWFENKRLEKSFTLKSRVEIYLEEQYHSDAPASYEDFLSKYRYSEDMVKRTTLNIYVSKWGYALDNIQDDEEREKKQYWFNNTRVVHKPTLKDQVWEYLDNRCASDNFGFFEDFLFYFGLTEPQIQRGVFNAYVRDWGQDISNIPDETEHKKRRDWFANKRFEPSLNQKLQNYFTGCYENWEIPSYALYIESNGYVSPATYSRGKSIWKQQAPLAKDSTKKLQWFGEKAAQEQKITWRVGTLFEEAILPLIYKEYQSRNIALFYQTIVHTLARIEGHSRKAKRPHVEIRLLVKDLLKQNSKIGPALRKFLDESQLPELAIDITLGSTIGSKIAKYADTITDLIIANVKGLNGQRNLEPNVRVIRIEDLVGTNWLNLDDNIQATVKSLLDSAFKAIRGGRKSVAFLEFKEMAVANWEEIAQKITEAGSQTRYQYRVLNDVIEDLKDGHYSNELIALIKSEQDAGRLENARTLEGLSLAILGLGIALRKRAHIKGETKWSCENSIMLLT